MKYIDDFLEYLLVVKKHSENTIINYRVDILEFNEFINDKILDVNKDDDIISVITCTRFFGIDDRKDFRIVGRLVRDDEKINDYSVKRNRNYVQVEEKMKGDDVDDIDA